MLQHNIESQQSEEDITIEYARASIDDDSKEKYDVEPVNETSVENSEDDVHPDGGLAAWLVVVGVRLFFFFYLNRPSHACFFLLSLGDVWCMLDVSISNGLVYPVPRKRNLLICHDAHHLIIETDSAM